MTKIDGVEILGINLEFYHSDFDKTSFDFGTLRLQKDDREYVLDTSCGVLNNGTLEVNVFEFDMPDEDILKHGKQNLKAIDLHDLDKAELFIGDEYEEEPDSMTLFVKFINKDGSGCTKAIELTQD